MGKDYILERKIYRYKTITKYQNKAKLLGYSDCDKQVFKFLNTRILVSFILFSYFLLTSNLITSIVVSILFYMIFSYYMFDYKIKKRSSIIEKDAIYFFEILSLTLEAGKSLIQGLELTSTCIDNELSKEINNTLKELDYGKSFYESFTNLRKRIPSDIVDNVLLNIIDSYTSGRNIVSALREQVEFIQNKRVLDLKKKMNQIPIKISVVSVFLFIPLVLLLILAPVILEYFS